MNPQGHIAHLDGWRGLAISAVFFGHFVSKAHYWWVGTFGVALFFVLSGFLMCNILFFKSTKLPDFFARRLIRCLVSCDHIPRRSWPLFRAKAALDELIAGFSNPGIQPQQEQLAA